MGGSTAGGNGGGGGSSASLATGSSAVFSGLTSVRLLLLLDPLSAAASFSVLTFGLVGRGTEDTSDVTFSTFLVGLWCDTGNSEVTDTGGGGGGGRLSLF